MPTEGQDAMCTILLGLGQAGHLLLASFYILYLALQSAHIVLLPHSFIVLYVVILVFFYIEGCFYTQFLLCITHPKRSHGDIMGIKFELLY